MRIVLIGQAAFAERVLDGLLERGHEVAALYCPPDRAGTEPDPLKARGLAVGIPVRQHKSLKHSDVRREFSELRVDLGVLAYVTQIVPAEVIEAPRLGSICFHPSLLPRYRGGSAIPWQIIKGETRTGVTVFWTDPGIDTGPILLQTPAAIGPDDTAGSLYYGTLFAIGVDAVLQSVDLIAAGKAPRVPQDDSQATYDPLLSDQHAEVDWSRPVGEVYDLIRGCDPQPGAFVLRDGTPLRFFSARREEGRGQAPGTVEAIDPEGILVSAGGGSIRMGRVRLANRKIGAFEAARELGLTTGDRL